MVRRGRRRNRRARGKKVGENTKRYVRAVMKANIETKYLDVAISGTASAVSFYGVNISNAVTQGTSRSNRVGARVQITGLRYLFEVQPGDNENVFRLMLATYRPGGTLGTTASMLPSILGMVNTDTFRVHRDFVGEARFGPVNGSTAATVNINKYYRGFIPMRSRLNFGSGTASVSDAVVLQFHSDSVVPPDAGVVGTVRIYFKDA